MLVGDHVYDFLGFVRVFNHTDEWTIETTEPNSTNEPVQAEFLLVICLRDVTTAHVTGADNNINRSRTCSHFAADLCDESATRTRKSATRFSTG